MKILTKDKLLTAYSKKRMDAVGKDLIANGRIVRDASWEVAEGSSLVSRRTCTIRRHDHLWELSMRGDTFLTVTMLEAEAA